jgi:hypothetical protein
MLRKITKAVVFAGAAGIGVAAYKSYLVQDRTVQISGLTYNLLLKQPHTYLNPLYHKTPRLFDCNNATEELNGLHKFSEEVTIPWNAKITRNATSNSGKLRTYADKVIFRGQPLNTSDYGKIVMREMNSITLPENMDPIDGNTFNLLYRLPLLAVDMKVMETNPTEIPLILHTDYDYSESRGYVTIPGSAQVKIVNGQIITDKVNVEAQFAQNYRHF